jgi:hypothetical protein
VASTKHGNPAHTAEPVFQFLSANVRLRLCRLQSQGEGEMREASLRIDELTAQVAALELDIREKEDEIQGLQVRTG